MSRTRPRIVWILGNAIALTALVLLASRWWADGELGRASGSRGLAAYLNAASTLPILLLSEMGRLLILALAGIVHLAALARAVWHRNWLMVALVAATLICWVVAAEVLGVDLLRSVKGGR